MAQSQILHPSRALQWETADKIVKTWQCYVSRMQDLERAIQWYFITDKKKKKKIFQIFWTEDMQTNFQMDN